MNAWPSMRTVHVGSFAATNYGVFEDYDTKENSRERREEKVMAIFSTWWRKSNHGLGILDPVFVCDFRWNEMR